MIAIVLNISGETYTDDIQLVFRVQYDETDPPQDSIYRFIAEHTADTSAAIINQVGSISGDVITFNIPRAQTIPSGLWTYRIREETAGDQNRTPVRGKIQLNIVPQP